MQVDLVVLEYEGIDRQVRATPAWRPHEAVLPGNRGLYAVEHMTFQLE